MTEVFLVWFLPADTSGNPQLIGVFATWENARAEIELQTDGFDGWTERDGRVWKNMYGAHYRIARHKVR